MAVKHIKEYYDKVCKDYREAIEEIKDFEKEVQDGIVEPERIENLKQVLKPLMNNYEQISYIMFLLNKPTRKSKESKYIGQNKKLLSKILPQNTTEELLKQNKDVLNKLKVL
jgi:hypothetical protein